MENITIDIIPGDVHPVCHASQKDVGRVIQINIKEISEYFIIDGSKSFVFEMKKPDTCVVTAPVTYSYNDYKLYLTTTEQMCACSGSNICEIKITERKTVIGTLNFILEIEDNPDNITESVSEIYDLEDRIREIVRKWS